MKIIAGLRFLFVLSSLIIIQLLNACSSGQNMRQADEPARGDFLPYVLDFTDLEGDTVRMTNFKDQVLFINIWATWCPPCLKELPSIQALSNRIDHPDVKFILLSPEDTSKLKEFLKNNDLDLPTYSLYKSLPPVLKDEYIPRTYIVDRFGKIVHKHVGERDWNTQEIFEFLNFLASANVTEN